MSFDDATEVLYAFSQKQIGSNSLIKSLYALVQGDAEMQYKNFKASGELIKPHTGYKCIVALDAIQMEDRLTTIYQIASMMDQTLDYQQLYTLKQIFAKSAENKQIEGLASKMQQKIDNLWYLIFHA